LSDKMTVLGQAQNVSSTVRTAWANRAVWHCGVLWEADSRSAV